MLSRSLTPAASIKMDREEALRERLERIKTLEEEIAAREKALRDKESARKQIVLRLSPSLWSEIAKWADEDFRSINGQIEYILTDAVSRRKK